MSIFKVNNTMKSYRYPIIKIIIGIIFISFFITNGYFIQFNNKIVEKIISILACILSILCIFCIYISIAEIDCAYDNLKMIKLKNEDINKVRGRVFELKEVIQMVQDNEIIEIITKDSSSIIKIGSSSDFNKSSGKFLGKLYYLDEIEYPTINEFKDALIKKYENKKTLDIISIDGVSTSK